MSAVALYHHPMTDKKGEVITTALTSIDIHDIARSCTTYGVEKYYIIHPLAGSRAIASRIIDHWQKSDGRLHNPDRASAISRIALVESREQMLEDAKRLFGEELSEWVTDAREWPGMPRISYREAQFRRGVILAFGTGSGMTLDYLRTFDWVLEPIWGPAEYNHLSVRSAVAVTLDRLLGRSGK